MNRLTIALILIAHAAMYAQDFEGRITYKRRIIAIDPSINPDSILNASVGDSMVYAISGPYYKCKFFRKGKYVYTYTYRHPDFRFYSEYERVDYMTYSDSRKTNDSIVSFLIYPDSVITVAGHSSFMVEKTFFRSGNKEKSYHSDDVRINPETFKGHKASNWYKELKKLNGRFQIKSVTKHEKYMEICEAIEIISEKIDSSYFEIPKDKLLIASSDALDEPAQVDITEQVRACYKLKAKNVSKGQNNKSVDCMISFIISENGKISDVKAINLDPDGLYKKAIDIVNNCGLKSIPGKINGNPVPSEFVMRIRIGI